MSVALWRIALASRSIAPTDLGGLGAGNTGGRWNSPGRPVVYAATSASLACLETVVHLNAGGLPLNRVLVRIDVPDEVWNVRQSLLLASLAEGWNAVPAGSVSAEAGNAWLDGLLSALLMVPSAIVPDEFNVLLNPRHADAAKVTATAVRPWTYDARLLVERGTREVP
ncbi:MAG: RES family NAD+ phosphorylase [Candidatus Accumulibacter meliphilus]|jgi:RES domain-containing protein|uniref:RES family NAD+ phosphorylase n=1 Tax=Candidatus Accumulibacter meliphilus TaxID=2211374 RepID=UPI002FC2DC78